MFDLLLGQHPDGEMEQRSARGTFAIGDSQDIGVFHASDNATSVPVEFDTERNFDFLDYQNSGAGLASSGDVAQCRSHRITTQMFIGTRNH
jgi:hypothetical protein